MICLVICFYDCRHYLTFHVQKFTECLSLYLVQISTCTRAHLQTSWAKTRPSHAPSALRPTSTTYARTSPKTTGSMVRTGSRVSTLTCRVHSKLVIALSPKLTASLLWHKEPLCALRMVIGIPMQRKQPTYSFSWNFYMNAIAEKGTTPTGEFTVCHKVHSLSHTTA